MKDGREEVYVVLAGSATLHSGGQNWSLGPGTLVRVGPGERCKFVVGRDGLTLLAIGATPGRAYEPTWERPVPSE